MGKRRHDLHELYRRAVAYIDRRAGAGMRRGGRGVGGSGSGGSGGGGFDRRKLYGISNFSTANFYQTAVDGGEAGVSTGFGDALLIYVRAIPTVVSVLKQRTDAAGAGYRLYADGTGGLRCYFYNGAGALVTPTPVYQLVPSDVGKAFLVEINVTGVAGQFHCARRMIANLAATGYTPYAAGQTSVGATPAGTAPATSFDILSEISYRGVPSQTQIEALFDQARTLWDLPPVFPQGSATDEDIAALAPRHWYRGDGYVPSGGNLGGLTNRNTTVGGLMNVVGGTIALPSADTKLNGQLSVKFSPAGGYLETSLANSEFSFMHNGAGFHGVVVWVRDADQNQPLYGTTPLAGGTEIGTNVWMSTGGAYRLSVASNGTASVNNAASSSVQNDVGTYTESSYVNGASPEFFATDGAAVIASGTDSSPPTTNAPLQKFAIGASATGVVKGNCRIADVIIFDRRLSESERQTVRDYIRVRYGVGAITPTHRWSLRDVLRGLSLPVTDGQTAPASLPDTVTAATIDRMDRQGSPTVKIIDPSVDGRKTYGALGFGGMNYFKSAGPTNGIVPTTPRWWVLWNGYFDAVSGNFSTLVGTTSNRFQGYQLYHHTTGSLGAFIQDSVGAVTAASASNVVATSDLLQPQVVILNQDGATLKIYFKGLEVASIAATLAPVVGSSPGMSIGVQGNGSGVFASGGTYCVQGGMSAALTLAEIAQLTASPRTAIAKTQRLYDLTQDVIDNGGPDNGIPLQVLDRIGTDHLTRVGGLQLNTAGGIAGLTKWAPNCIAATRAGGGLAGVGTGFFRAFDLILGPYTTTNGIFGKSDGGNNGDYFRITTSGLQWVVGDGGAIARSAILPLVAGDVTTRQRCVIQHDGANIRIYLGTSTNTISVACAGHTPYAAGPMSLGDILPNGASAQGTSTIYGIQSGNAILTAGEISALLADTTFAAVAGKTTYRVWIPDDVAEAGGKVPAVLKERISGTDNMVITGAPLQVAQRVEKLWSYERTPILYGTGNHSLANKYTAASGGAGNTLAFGGTLVWRPNATTVSATRVLVSTLQLSPNKGFDIRIAGANATVSVFFINASGANVPSGAPSLTGLYGKTCIFSFQFDGVTGRLRVYLNRVEAGTGVVAAGYAPPTGAITWGAEQAGTTAPGTDSDLFGFVLWDGLATLAQVQSQHDAILANDGRIQPMPGVTNTMLVDVTADAQANGGALPLLEDRIGNNDFTKVGSPIVATQYARAFGF